jgi:hypothetical protein
MSQMVGVPTSWKGTRSAEAAAQLIDYGVMLRWRDMRTIKRTLTDEEQKQIMKHFAKRVVERADERLQMEILVESALVWLANASDENLLYAFLEEFFAQPGADAAAWHMVEIALTVEVSENAHDEDIFEMAVALVCELGTSVQEYEQEYPGEFSKAHALLDHIATYLLSVSNANSSCIRLSLLHYFGVTEHVKNTRNCFNRIMSRFGHTVLDLLFSLLFRKRSEAIALQYLLENLPFILTADRHSQKIVFETFKFYMLKQPERFTLFIQAFSDHLISKDESYDTARQVFLQHLGALLTVVSEVNHAQLGRELLVAVVKFNDSPFCQNFTKFIIEESNLRTPYKDLLNQLLEGHGKEKKDSNLFRSSKRGRKPSFARVDGIGTMRQVNYLGGIELPKAS